MLFPTSSLSLPLLFSGLTLARPASVASYAKAPRAAYFLTNSHANAVASLHVHPDGTLSSTSFFPTGGNGEAAFFGDNVTVAGPDSLLSQAPIAIAGNLLFAVNSGSNSVSVFSIDENDPTKLKLLGSPVSVSGTFPNSVTASWEQKVVCVSTTGSQAGVSCATFQPDCDNVLKEFDGLRTFDLKQTDPPVGPPNTASQVLFSEDGSVLRAFVKGAGTMKKKNNGYVASYSVADGVVSRAGERTPGAPGATLFGSVNIPAAEGEQRVFTSDAAFGARVFAFSDGAAAKGQETAFIPTHGAGAPCWTAYSPLTGKGYIATVATERLIEVDVDAGQITRRFSNGMNGPPGYTDIVAAGKFVYAVSPGTPKAMGMPAVGAAVAVLDVSGDKIEEVMRFEVAGKGVVAGRPAGMAVFW